MEQFADYFVLWQKRGVLPMLRKVMIENQIAENLQKVVIGMISGFLVELFFGWMARRKKRPRDFDGEPHSGHCDCGTGIFVEAARHALKVFLFILYQRAAQYT